MRVSQCRADYIAALRTDFGSGLRCLAAGNMDVHRVMCSTAVGSAAMCVTVCILIAPC